MNHTILFKALSDRNRQRILKALQVRMLCSCEITEMLSLANSTVNQHMGVLKEAGLVTETKDGKWVNYYLNKETSDERIRELLKNLDLWIQPAEDIRGDIAKLGNLDRRQICST